MSKDPYDYILPFHVSIGKSSEKFPEGSGIFVKLTNEFNGELLTIFGILTATHVLEEIGLIKNNPKEVSILLTKPCNRNGDVYGVKTGFAFVYSLLDKKHGRYIEQNHKNEMNYEHDIAFIMLDIKRFGDNGFIKNSKFFDLDCVKKLDFPDDPFLPMILFRGACLDSEVKDNVINTGIYLIKQGKLKQSSKYKIKFYDSIYDGCESLDGASGGGLWMFCREEKKEVEMFFRGIVVRQSCDKKHIFSIDVSYILDVFLPALKKELCVHCCYNDSLNALYVK